MEKARKSFDQVKFRGLSRGRQGAWQTVGPVTEADESTEFSLEPGNATGRVTAIAIGDSCDEGRCRLYVGTAGGGVWRTDRALHPSNPGWRHLSNGIGGNNIGSLTLDPNDASGQTLYVGTGEANFNYTSGAGRGVFVFSFTRVDGAGSPPRFISGIALDHENPNRAFVSYSGFSALTPAAPGHVFEVVFDPGAGTAVFASLDFNLGDIPINHLVRDDPTGDLYAATDFGVLVLPRGAEAWELAGSGLPEVLTPHLEIHPESRLLFAATHGLGGWYLNLSKLRER